MSGGAGRDRLLLELRRSIVPALMFLALILAGVFAAVQVVRNLAGDKPWVSYAKYQVAFESVKGIVPGRVELRIAGVKAGSVAKSELKDGQAVLTLNVERKYAPLHTDAKIVIRPVTALEDEYVDITSRGSRDAPVLREGRILSQAQTKSQTEVGRVLNVLDGDTRVRFSSLLDELGAGTKDRGERMRQSFEELAPFLRVGAELGKALTARKQATARLVHNLGNITQVLATRDRQVAGFVDNGGKLLGTLAQHQGTLSSTISRLPGTLQNAQATFASLRGTTVPLDDALRSLSPVAKQLPSGLESLREFSREATPAVRSLRPSVTALRPLARELVHTSANGSAALTPLVAQFGQLAHGTKLAKPCLPILGATVNRVSSLLKYQGTGTLSPDARALVTVDLNGTLGAGAAKSSAYAPIVPPCFTRPDTLSAKNYGALTPIPSRTDAVSQEQK